MYMRCAASGSIDAMPKRKKGGGGGVRQRARRLNTPTTTPRPPVDDLGHNSKLGDLLLDLAGWKYISPQLVQTIAWAAFISICAAVQLATSFTPEQVEAFAASACPDLAILKDLGTSGVHSGNVNRDFLNKLGPQAVSSTRKMIPLKLPPGKMPKMVEQLFCFPHSMLQKLSQIGGKVWEDRVCPGGERLVKFWTSMRGHPNYTHVRDSFVARGIHDWEECVVPLKLYGDGCPVTGVGKSWGKSMTTYTFSSLVSVGTTLETVFLIWSVFTALMSASVLKKWNTQAQFWKELKHSLDACGKGARLDHDSDGKLYGAATVLGKKAGTVLCTVAGKVYYFVVFLLTGDLEWFYKELGLQPNIQYTFNIFVHKSHIRRINVSHIQCTFNVFSMYHRFNVLSMYHIFNVLSMYHDSHVH